MNVVTLIASFTSELGVIDAAVLVALAAVAAFLPGDEQTILYNALKAAKADIDAGKSVGTAIADAWTTFYQAELAEANKVGQFLLGAILNALAPKA
jgi:hypothetical protein